jgi:hypothetical protein
MAPGTHVALTQPQRALVASLFLIIATLGSLLVSFHFLPFAIDDALISFRYSDRLLHGEGLTWNDNEYVEGYSDLLWVLTVALGGLFSSNLVFVGWVIGSIANIATLSSISWTFGRQPNASIASVLAGLLLIAGSESFAFWGIAGMETAFANALLSWALACAYRKRTCGFGVTGWCSSLLFGLLSITRPDGVLFGVSAGIGALIRGRLSRQSIKESLVFAGSALIFTGLQVAFRLAYYGAPIPNTSAAKLSFNLERAVLIGGSYLARGAMANAALLITMALVIVMLWRSRGWGLLRHNAIFLVPGLVWLGYIGAIGGDWFPFERHWQPALICFTFATCSLISELLPLRTWLLAFLATTLLILQVLSQAAVDPYPSQFGRTGDVTDKLRREIRKVDPSGAAEHAFLSQTSFTRQAELVEFQRGYLECSVFGQFLRGAFSKVHALIAVNAAGCLPYFSRLPAIDMLGLNDFYIARHPPAEMGHGPIGHELGDGSYVLSRKPDLIVFCGTGLLFGVAIPCSRSDSEIAGSPNFKKDYRLLFYRAEPYEMAIWTRIEHSRLGIIRTHDSIYIPGFMLAANSGAYGMLDSSGRMVTNLQRVGAHLDDIELPAGIWDVYLRTDRPDRIRLETLPTSVTTSPDSGTLRIVSAGGPISFRIVGSSGLIYGIFATRLTSTHAGSRSEAGL